MITLSVQTQPAAVFVNDCRITDAPTIAELQAMLGEPARIYGGESPAPAGHRNNQIHIYDDLGLTFNEHHHTQLVQAISSWFETDDPQFPFTPRRDFTGQLLFDGKNLPLGGDIREFMAASPLLFGDGFAGGWQYKFEGFCVVVSSRGSKLRSGRRSTVMNVECVTLAWPHDPWAAQIC